MDELLYKYSQQFNLKKLLYVFLFGQLCGLFAYYLNHKIRVIEPHMVEEYGRDYPVFVRLKFYRLQKEFVAKYFWFQMYNLGYFVNET